jgi:hypothetical protein
LFPFLEMWHFGPTTLNTPLVTSLGLLDTHW